MALAGLPAGFRVDAGLKVYTEETTTEVVSVEPGTTGWYVRAKVDGGYNTGTYLWDLPGWDVTADPDWLAANGYQSDEAAAMVALPPITGGLDVADPYFGPVMYPEHTEISGDVPPGPHITERPTLWAAGSGLTVDAGDNAAWTVGTAPGVVTRTLATRFWLRMAFLAGISTVEDWLDPLWPLKIEANQELASDHAEWVAAVPVEDVQNYDNCSQAKFTFASFPAGAVGETAILTIGYSLLSVQDPRTEDHGHRFGAEADPHWAFQRSQYTVALNAVVAGDGSLTFDLGKLQRSNVISLQHVDSLSLALPTVGLWQFADFRLKLNPSWTGLLHQPALAPSHFLTDFAGYGSTVDGISHLNIPDGSEQFVRVELGIKGTWYWQHNPDSELADDPTYALPLSWIANVIDWQEQLTSNFDGDAVEAATVDDEDDRIGVVYDWDAYRGNGDVEAGINAAVHIGEYRGMPYSIPFCPVTVHWSWTAQGRAHGLIYDGDDRVTGGGEVADDGSLTYQVVRQPSGGGSWEVCGSCEPDAAGRFRTNPLLKYGYTYGLRTPDNTIISLGGFASRQYAIAGLVAGVGGRDPDIAQDASGRTLLAYISADGTKLICRWWESPESALSDEVTIYTGSKLRHPSLVLLPDGTAGCWWMADTTQMAAVSAKGAYSNWTLRGAGMLGDDLQYAAVGHLRGIVFAAGLKDGACVMEWSNDGGATKSAVPGGGTTVEVCDSMAEQQPAITPTPTGQMLVLVPGTDNVVRGFVSDQGGIGTWRAAGSFAA